MCFRTTAHADQPTDAEVNLLKTANVAPQHAQVAPVERIERRRES